MSPEPKGARPTTCAMCGRPAGTREANPAFPFCSERCRMLDLGNWLGEAYRVPTDEAPESGGEVPPPGRPTNDDQ